MTRWWTSDHHFGHENIIQYCARPFVGADEMNHVMVDRWNDAVADSDEVWILGDLVMKHLVPNLTDHVARLKGHKVLVPGNHDTCWEGHKKGGRRHADYHDLGGIARIVDNPKPIRLANRLVVLSHFPFYNPDSQYDQRYEEWRPENTGDWLFHGHVHEKWRQNGKQINVGVDAWAFAPVNDDTLAEMIAQGQANVPCPAYDLTAA